MNIKSGSLVMAVVIGISGVLLGVLGLKLKHMGSISPEQSTELRLPAQLTQRFGPSNQDQASTQAQSVPKPPAAPSPWAVTNEVRHPGTTTAGARGNRTTPRLKNNGYDVQDPMARLALSFVGMDPEATEYWLEAINDPELPPEERKDLIEDLNEDGFPDPQHPSPADRPLIASRLQLIESAAPYAIDKVNADAFAEAYKDLVGMLNGEAPQ